MTEQEARQDIEILTEHTSSPGLSYDEVSLLVRKAKRADRNNRAPSDDAWEPTWNINYAVALGWRMKAGKLVGRFDFRDANGNQFSRSQFRAHCVEQARHYSSRASESVTLEGGWRRRVILGETNGVLEEDLEC